VLYIAPLPNSFSLSIYYEVSNDISIILNLKNKYIRSLRCI
jgi:hypothetical protein